MILVTGATGQLGATVIQTLLKKTSANQIAALVRDESKAASLKEMGVDVRVGDYGDTISLNRAMQGIGKVLLIAGTDEQKRLQQHQNVINAAKKAGVSCIAYTSRNLKNRDTLVNRLMEGHFQTEEAIEQSGLRYVIFRNVLYMDTIPIFVGENVFEKSISLPTGHGRASFALRSDMGEAIANALLEGDCGNRIYRFTGSEACSFEDVAAALTRLSGKEVTYTSADRVAFETRMKERGLPDVAVQRASGFLTDIKNGQEDEVTPDLEKLLGRKPTSLDVGLKTLFKL